MKQLISYVLVVFISVLISVNAHSQSISAPLESAVRQIDQASNPAEWKQGRSAFERLTMVDATAWLPMYYLAYTDIQLSFMSSDPKEKMQYIDEAQTCLEKLQKMKVQDPKDRSEISTLKGYWYYAQMAMNPAVNGPRYSGAIINCYQEALKLNPNNPRAIFLNASFQENMAQFMNGHYPSLEEDMKRADVLFSQEPTDTVAPHWGRRGK